ncbi:uncharacterized protein LOC144151543 [Haemaphysalis longicornis]
MSDSEDTFTVQDVLVKGYSQLGEWCRWDANCSTENSGCVAEICACKLGFLLYEDKCVPELRSRGLSKAYLASIGCFVSILIFSMSLCFLYWKRKMDDRRDLGADETFPVSLAATASAPWLESRDKPPSYEDACMPSVRFNLEDAFTAAPNSWHALPVTDGQVRFPLPPEYREAQWNSRVPGNSGYVSSLSSRASI